MFAEILNNTITTIKTMPGASYGAVSFDKAITNIDEKKVICVWFFLKKESDGVISIVTRSDTYEGSVALDPWWVVYDNDAKIIACSNPKMIGES